LKYAQTLAVASGCPVRMQIDSSGYLARQQAALGGSCDSSDASWPTNVALADGQVLAGSSPIGVAASPAVTLTFDALGRTNLGSDQSITVGPFALTVRAESGFVQAP
jgi:MSHA pilin protein MshC